MSAQRMARLRRTAALVLNTERYGGTLTQRDDSTIILKNYRCLNSRVLSLLQEQFPVRRRLCAAPDGKRAAELELRAAVFRCLHFRVCCRVQAHFRGTFSRLDIKESHTACMFEPGSVRTVLMILMLLATIV
jgi:hypothetical protein